MSMKLIGKNILFFLYQKLNVCFADTNSVIRGGNIYVQIDMMNESSNFIKRSTAIPSMILISNDFERF